MAARDHGADGAMPVGLGLGRGRIGAQVAGHQTPRMTPSALRLISSTAMALADLRFPCEVIVVAVCW